MSVQKEMNQEDFLALVWAVYDKPGIVGLLRPGQARKVFGEILEHKPEEIARIFRIAEATHRAEFLHLAINHAIMMGKVQELWFSFLRIARVWASRGYVPEWDDEVMVEREVQRLIALLNCELYEELIVSINPSNGLWFAGMVNCDVIWEKWIDDQMEHCSLDEAFDTLIVAGTGLMEDDPHDLRKQWSEKDWLAINEAKFFTGDDSFGWNTYARARNFEYLVDKLWASHVALGIFHRSYLHNVRLIGRCMVNIRRTGNHHPVSVPIRGLILRGAQVQDEGFVDCEDLSIPWPPEQVMARLNQTSGKLYHMFEVYRGRQFMHLRLPNVNVRELHVS